MFFIDLKLLKNKLFWLFLFLFLALAFNVNAAVLSVSPNSGQYNVDSIFTINVLVSSSNQSINVVSGEISFDAAKLEVVSVTKTGSIMGLWVQEPNFSNILGTINFEGIILNPGFLGNNGKVASVIFKAKNPGTIKLLLTSVSILANDGEGTDVLSSLEHGHYTIVSEETTTTKLVNVSIIPASTTTQPKATKTTVVATTTKDCEQSLIVGEPVIVEEIIRKELTNPNVKFSIKVHDLNWEIDKFIIRIDNGNAITWQDDGSNIYNTPKLKPGGHILELSVFGKDGKIFEIKKGFIVKSLKVPIWKKWLQSVKIDEPFILEGITEYPSSEVTITVIRDIAEQSRWINRDMLSSLNNITNQDQFKEYFKVITNEDGLFKLDLTNKLSAGHYFVMANVSDNNGGASYNTYEQSIEVIDESFVSSDRLTKTIVCLIAASTSVFFVTLSLIALCKHLYNRKSIANKMSSDSFKTLEKTLNLLIQNFRKYTDLSLKDQYNQNINIENTRQIEEIKDGLIEAESILNDRQENKG